MQSTVEPGFGELQIAVHGGAGDAENLGGLFIRATQEVAELDDPDFAFVQKLKFRECLIEGQHFFARGVDPCQIWVQGNSRARRTGTFLRMRAAAEITEN